MKSFFIVIVTVIFWAFTGRVCADYGLADSQNVKVISTISPGGCAIEVATRQLDFGTVVPLPMEELTVDEKSVDIAVRCQTLRRFSVSIEPVLSDEDKGLIQDSRSNFAVVANLIKQVGVGDSLANDVSRKIVGRLRILSSLVEASDSFDNIDGPSPVLGSSVSQPEPQRGLVIPQKALATGFDGQLGDSVIKAVNAKFKVWIAPILKPASRLENFDVLDFDSRLRVSLIYL